jgi:hypothetical protein
MKTEQIVRELQHLFALLTDNAQPIPPYKITNNQDHLLEVARGLDHLADRLLDSIGS